MKRNRRVRRGRGFSLTELLLGSVLLAIAMAAAFTVFDIGSYYFRVGLMRQSMQNNARRAMLWMERDLRQSNLDGISTDSGTTPGGSKRDVLCMPGMDNWEDPANFDANSGAPQYNRYVIYFASRTEPKLYRVEFLGGNQPNEGDPWDNFPTTVFTGWNAGPPATIDGFAAVTRELADQLAEYIVTTPNNGTVQCTLLLREVVQNSGESGNKRDEMIQLNLYTPVYNRSK